MKIERKEGVRGIRIVEHNKKVFWTIIALLVLLIGIWVYLRFFAEENKVIGECLKDSDCVSDSCCHASSCVALNKAPNCNGIRCSQECQAGTLDCNQGSCKCVQGKCGAVFK